MILQRRRGTSKACTAHLATADGRPRCGLPINPDNWEVVDAPFPTRSEGGCFWCHEAQRRGVVLSGAARAGILSGLARRAWREREERERLAEWNRLAIGDDGGKQC